MTVRIVLFDLGNVIVDWRPLRLYRQIFDSEVKARWFCENICTLEWHTEHDRGVSMAQNAARLIQKHPEYEAEILAWRTRWLDMFEGYVPDVPELVTRLEQNGAELYGLSNLPAEVADETFDAFPVIRTLKDIVISGVEGVVKPDPAIYTIALERMGHPDPSTVLFIDDRADNIAAARKLGFLGHVFVSADRLEAELDAHGLLS